MIMRSTLLATASALSFAIAAPALAGDGWNHHRHYGNGWVGPFVGGLAGAAIIGEVLAAPSYGYAGYGYAPYYAYPSPLVPPQPRWCPGPYGPYQC